MSFLHELLERLAEIPLDDQPSAILDQINDSDINVKNLSDEVLDLYNDITGGEEAATPQELLTLETLGRVADGIQVVIQQAEERSARANEIGERLRGLGSPAAETDTDNGDTDGDGDGDETDTESGGDVENTDTDGGIGTDIGTDGGPTGGGATVDAGAAAAGRELVTAGNRPRVPARAPRVPLGQMRSNRKLPEKPAARKQIQPKEEFSLVAAADVPGFGVGQPMRDMGDFANAWESRMMPMITSGVNNGVDGQRTRVGIARLKRNMPDQFTINDDHEALEKIEYATSEYNLPGGSLVAAAGWCAPSETLYDLCPIRITQEGLVSLPSIVARRGGIRYPADFDWTSVWGDIGFYLSETEVIAGTEKPCIEVPCPTEWQECRLDVAGLCIRTPILMERGWPERVRQFMEGALLVHAHKMNARQLAKMEELSTLIQFPAPPAPDPTAAITDPHGPGAIESTMSMLELIVQYYRYNERLAQTDTLEMIAPFWLRGLLKSDLRKKLGIDNRWNVTDAQLDSYFRSVGVNPQWVYDWQDSFSHPLDPSGFGGPIPTVWPDSVKILLFRAGTFFRLTADVISLDGVYDHASLTQNIYTALFTEEGWQICSRCGKSYVVEIPLCPNGLSGGIQTTQCADPAPAPAG